MLTTIYITVTVESSLESILKKLQIFSYISVFVGVIVYANAKSAIHEIEAFVLFLLAAVLYSGYSIISALKVLEVDPSTHVKCPDCRELVLTDAKKCKHCGCSLTPQ
jgi:hypothetical protein